MNKEDVRIGSKVTHPEHGEGVVLNRANEDSLEVRFMKYMYKGSEYDSMQIVLISNLEPSSP